jgi:hypothetical protein
MNPQPNSPERSTTADSANVSFTPPPGPSPSAPAPANPPASGTSSQASAKAGSGADKHPSAEKAALIARVRERLSGPPSVADGTVPTKELEMENRLRARVLAGSDVGAARLTRDTARTINRTWDEYGGALLAYPRDTPPKERLPLPPLPDNAETSTDD